MYSQNEEERYILEAVGGRIGRFLDIGAYDGKTFSNTLALVERGWSGILVEPGLWAFQELLRRHGSNDFLSLVHAAIGCGPRLTQFWDAPEPYATTQMENRAKWGGHAHFSPAYFTPVIDFEDLLSTCPGQIDMLSIDTEGTSVDLFLKIPCYFDGPAGSFSFPSVVCVEHDGRIAECLEHAGHYGYKLRYQSAENLVLVR